MKKLKAIPRFRSLAAERKFWETHNTTQYLDWSRSHLARFPNLKPSTRLISLQMPVYLLERIKVEANRRDVSYKTLIKVWLDEKIAAGIDRRPSRFENF